MAKQILTASHSSYPKIGDGPGEQQLRQAHHKLDRGEITRAAFAEIERNVIRQVIGEQESTGLDIVTDGQIRWNDPVSHQTRSLDNVQITGLLRFFDTNFYFRQPLVTGPIKFRESALAEEANLLIRTTQRTPKVVLTGPYTLTALSKAQAGIYAERQALLEDYAETVAAEVAALVRTGVRRIQIDEPALVRSPGDVEIVCQALTGLLKKQSDVTLELALYFGDAVPLLPQLAEFPVDSVTFDLTYSPKLVDTLAARGFPLGVGLGIVDARNTRPEETARLVPAIKKVAAKVQGDVVLTTSCGLEYLPRDKARAKLKLLAELKERL